MCAVGVACIQLWYFFLKAGGWRRDVSRYLQQVEVGDKRSLSSVLATYASQLAAHPDTSSWPPVIPKDSPQPAAAHARKKANREGLPCGCFVCEADPACVSNPYTFDLWQGTVSPWTSTFSSAKWCIWHVVRVKQDNHIRCLKQCWLMRSTQYTVARIVTIITRATGYVEQTSQTVMGT